MKKYSIGIIILLIFSIFIACSEDKPTENETDLTPSKLLVGSWDLTIIKANGIIVDPLNDTLNVYINNGIYTFNADNSGIILFDQGDTYNFIWSINSDTLIFNYSIRMRFILDGDDLSTFQAGDSTNNIPDLEFNYIRI